MVTKRFTASERLSAGLIETVDTVSFERRQFRALMVGNPNYFGTLPNSPFEPVVQVAGNTTYELIKSVGFQPQENRLDAVVFLNQSYGYGGDVCTAGSREYVRFYLSFDGGASWVDQGATSFVAYDVPPSATGGRRLECAVSLPAAPPRTWCGIPNLIRARAILSWQVEPTAGMPDFPPVWGDVHDTLIQVDPQWFLKWVDLFKLAEVKLPPDLVAVVDLDQKVAASPKALGAWELKELYQDKGVEPQRFAMAEIQTLMKAPSAAFAAQHPFYAIPEKDWGFKLSDVIGKLFDYDGNTDYEELDCVGLRSRFGRHELVGVVLQKRSNGFSGGPCTSGSLEYVTFWGDFDGDGRFETCLGTTSVRVYDLPVPEGDAIEYSVNLPVDLNPYLRPCKEGPRVAPIRAILSWNQPPDCVDPDWVPPWGNREETLVLLPPGDAVQVGDFSPELHEVSYVAVCDIDQANGRAHGVSPFGGRLCITGAIPGAAYLGGVDLEYRLWATQGATTAPITTPFSVSVRLQTGPGTSTTFPADQSASPDGWFRYLEYGPMTQIVDSPERLLGYWDTGGLTGPWTIHVEARRISAPLAVYSAAVNTCVDGTARSSVIVSLDQEPPVATIGVSGFWTGDPDAGGAFSSATNCGDFTQGVVIEGWYDATDNIAVSAPSLALEPNLEPPAAPIAVTDLTDPGSTATHRFGRWRVATAGLDPCGYVIHMTAYDRTVANCNGAWRDDATVGFCLRAPS